MLQLYQLSDMGRVIPQPPPTAETFHWSLSTNTHGHRHAGCKIIQQYHRSESIELISRQQGPKPLINRKYSPETLTGISSHPSHPRPSQNTSAHLNTHHKPIMLRVFRWSSLASHRFSRRHSSTRMPRLKIFSVALSTPDTRTSPPHSTNKPNLHHSLSSIRAFLSLFHLSSCPLPAPSRPHRLPASLLPLRNVSVRALNRSRLFQRLLQSRQRPSARMTRTASG